MATCAAKPTEISGVQSVVDGLLVDRPRRNILRARAESG
jgi:hypothetical protein